MANLRIYNGDAIGQNRLSADWLNRRLASGAEGCGFDPRLAYHFKFGLSLQNTQSSQWGMDNPLFYRLGSRRWKLGSITIKTRTETRTTAMN